MAPEAGYQAGARGWQWIKLKRDYRAELTDTLDLVVVGGLAGRGRRADRLPAPYRRLGPAQGGGRPRLGFPRFTGRWRDDKAPTDATTVEEAVAIYRTARRLPADA